MLRYDCAGPSHPSSATLMQNFGKQLDCGFLQCDPVALLTLARTWGDATHTPSQFFLGCTLYFL